MVVARFTVRSVEKTHYDKPVYENGNYVRSEKLEMATIRMSPVYSNDPNDPNKKFWEATPSGDLMLGTINEAAWSQFELGKTYEITFSKVE